MFALAAVAFLSATLNAQPVVKPKSFYEGRTYTWTNANGGTVTSNLADPATDPRQIMALLKEVYTNTTKKSQAFGNAATPLMAKEKAILITMLQETTISTRFTTFLLATTSQMWKATPHL